MLRMQFIKRYTLPIILIFLMIGAYMLDLHNTLSFEELQTRKEEFRLYAKNHPLLSAFIFSALYIICVALSLPIASLLTLLGGFLFGFWAGTLIVVTSATIGATIIFVIAKTSFGKTLREKASGLYQKIETNMQDNAASYLLFMRLVPIFPFFLVNIVPALFNVPLRTYVLTTFFGILPGSAVYVFAGQSLGEINSVKEIFSGDVIGAFILLGVFALIPTIHKRYKKAP